MEDWGRMAGVGERMKPTGVFSCVEVLGVGNAISAASHHNT